ncbi:MAG: polysaccharide deacetylase family protein, partial [Ginsengibacter sp.]
MLYFIKSPWFLRKMYPECIWKIPTEEKILYLTFDDGPSPNATYFVLDELRRYNARATFFCVGKKVKENLETYKQILYEGHKVGNHTYDHLNGWKTPDKEYLENIEKASSIIDSPLFRPPYGRITKFQLKAIENQKFQLTTIMWSVISADFDTTVKPENCYLNVVKNAKEGSIVVFHDSKKAFPNLRIALPQTLEYFASKGYTFKSIPS